MEGVALLGGGSASYYTQTARVRINYDKWRYYEGEVRDDKPHGFGTMHYGEFDESKRDTYVGEFQDGLKSGKGVLTWKNGCKYTGEFLNDVLHGSGRYEAPALGQSFGMALFEGSYVNDIRKGHGKYTITSINTQYREYLEGEWEGDCCTGKKELTLSSGGRFIQEGTFRNEQLWSGTSTRCFNGFITPYKDGTQGEERPPEGSGGCCVIS